MFGYDPTILAELYLLFSTSHEGGPRQFVEYHVPFSPGRLRMILEQQVALASILHRGWREFQAYQSIFGLPTIERREELDLDVFRQIRPDIAFVLCVLYDDSDRLYFIRDYSSSSGWELPGGVCLPEESLTAAITRIVDRDAPCELTDVTPVALCRNVFAAGSFEKSHLGIAFAAHCVTPPKTNDRRVGQFFRQIPERLPYANRQIALLARGILATRRHDAPVDEVRAYRRRQLRHLFHKRFVAPLLDPFTSKRLREAVADHVRPTDTLLLDASCGYDSLIFGLEAPGRTCVANDVSWSMVKLLARRASSSNVILTNQNLLQLQFARRFDVVICKNTLHHLESAEEMAEALARFATIGRRLIIMDIENPLRSSMGAQLWHSYYARFLGDRGGTFLTRDQLTELLRLTFPRAEVTVRRVPTMKGDYLLSVIDI